MRSQSQAPFVIRSSSHVARPIVIKKKTFKFSRSRAPSEAEKGQTESRKWFILDGMISTSTALEGRFPPLPGLDE
jgi:hypothetical protein